MTREERKALKNLEDMNRAALMLGRFEDRKTCCEDPAELRAIRKEIAYWKDVHEKAVDAVLGIPMTWPEAIDYDAILGE